MYGLWAFFPKLAVGYISPKSALIYQMMGGIVVIIAVLVSMKFKVEMNTKGIIFALATGITGALGSLLFFYALTKGKTSTVVLITALYPLVTIGLSYFLLQETITLKQGMGMVLALSAIVLMVW